MRRESTVRSVLAMRLVRRAMLSITLLCCFIAREISLSALPLKNLSSYSEEMNLLKASLEVELASREVFRMPKNIFLLF